MPGCFFELSAPKPRLPSAARPATDIRGTRDGPTRAFGAIDGREVVRPLLPPELERCALKLMWGIAKAGGSLMGVAAFELAARADEEPGIGGRGPVGMFASVSLGALPATAAK
jgi:hypothetical protein